VLAGTIVYLNRWQIVAGPKNLLAGRKLALAGAIVYFVVEEICWQVNCGLISTSPPRILQITTKYSTCWQVFGLLAPRGSLKSASRSRLVSFTMFFAFSSHHGAVSSSMPCGVTVTLPRSPLTTSYCCNRSEMGRGINIYAVRSPRVTRILPAGLPSK